jgi:hypothetical protein
MNFTVDKSSPKIKAASEIFKKVAQVNNRPLGENYPNLVTLDSALSSQAVQVFLRRFEPVTGKGN